MERVLRNAPSTVTFKFYADGVLTDTDDQTASVDVTGGDGTVLYTDAPTTHVSTGVFEYNLPSQTTVNRLTVDCTGVFAGDDVVVSEVVEVVGGFLFTVEELREEYPLLTVAKYPDAKVMAKRTLVENLFSDNTGQRAFVPTYHYEVLTGTGTYELWLQKPELRSVLSLTEDDVDISGTAVLRTNPLQKHVLTRRDDIWSCLDYDNIKIGYEYGRDIVVPNDVQEAAMKLCKYKLTEKSSGIDERATSVQTDTGLYRLSVPGWRRAVTGLPEVDKVMYDYDISGEVF